MSGSEEPNVTCAFALDPLAGFQICQAYVCRRSGLFAQTCTWDLRSGAPGAAVIPEWLIELWRNVHTNGMATMRFLLPEESWPPSPEFVCINAPNFILFVGLLVFILAGLMMSEKFTSEELDAQQEQKERRLEVMKELNESLEGEKFDTDEPASVELATLLQRHIELNECDSKSTELNRCIQLGAKLVVKELRIGLKKTAEGKDPEYVDGTKLDRTWQQSKEILNLAHKKSPLPPDVRRELLEKQRETYYLRRRQRRAGVFKAAKLCLNNPIALTWVIAESCVSILNAVISATIVFYRAAVLETFRKPNFEWSDFSRACAAMVYAQLITTFLNLLVSNLKMRGEAVIGQGARSTYFNAMLHQDQNWWSKKKGRDAYAALDDCFKIGESAKMFLQVPQQVFTSLTHVLTHATLVCNKSSDMLVVMIVLSWSTSLVFRGFHYLQRQLDFLALAGVVQPSTDDYTWIYALQPEYAQMFQSFAREKTEANVFSRYLESETRADKRIGLVDAFTQPVRDVLGQMSSIGEFAASGRLVRSGRVGVGEAEALLRSARGIRSDATSLFTTWSNIERQSEPLSKAFDLIHTPPSINPDGGITPPGRAKGHIEFKGVVFKYPSRDALVLKGTSFKVKPGQVLGMTGSAGCGKSTALRLLERFYDVNEGEILLDGRNIRDYSVKWLRSQIACVAQEPKLLPMSIRDNLAFGCPKEPTTEQILDACKAANIYEQLMDKNKFPEGLRTKMSMVQNVSGGEKQRLAIARAILADPPILLLDEATSALDEENQQQVQAALQKLMESRTTLGESRTTLVIAHRLSTIRSADKIVAFKEGAVVEEGTHDELLKREGGLYAGLWKKQLGTEGASKKPPVVRQTSSTGEADEMKPGASEQSSKSRDPELVQISRAGKLSMLQRGMEELRSGESAEHVDWLLEIIEDLRAEALDESRQMDEETTMHREAVAFQNPKLAKWIGAVGAVRTINRMKACLGETEDLINSTPAAVGPPHLRRSGSMRAGSMRALVDYAPTPLLPTRGKTTDG